MKVSSKGRQKIKQEEGERLVGYLDSRGIPTIGVGHTSAAGPPKVTKGMKITSAQSDEILSRDLGDVEGCINTSVKVPLTQNQFDALASLIFNIGEPAFKKSTLLKKLNAKDYAGAADQFPVWKKAGKDTAILLARRRRERELFLTIDSGTAAKPETQTDKTTIRVVQERLKELGYTEVGAPDGKMGKLTQTAILAFRNEHDLPVTTDIDKELLLALDDAEPRDLPRNDVAPYKIRAAAPEVQSNFITKVGAAAGAGTLGLGSVGDLASKATSFREYIDPWKDMFSDIPGWVWLAGGAVLLVVIAFIARRGELRGIEAFKSGERR